MRTLRALVLLLVLVPFVGPAAPCCVAEPAADDCCAPASSHACPTSPAGDCALTTADAPALATSSSAPPPMLEATREPAPGLRVPEHTGPLPVPFASNRASPFAHGRSPLRL